MQRVALEHPDVAARVAEALREGAVAVQLPTVYALLGAPTLAGAAALDRVKARRPGKTYSSFAGRAEGFLRLVRPGTLPPGCGPGTVPALVGAIVRCTVADLTAHTPAVRAGTHQALFLDGPWRALAVALEAAWAARADPALYAGAAYSAVLATSLNESGHPEGSIVDRARRALRRGPRRGPLRQRGPRRR